MEEEECSICLREFDASSDCPPKSVTKCGHTFCESCIGTYALKHLPAHLPVPCPMCRAPLAPEDLPQTVAIDVPHENGRIGLLLVKRENEPHVRVSGVLPASGAHAVGLRPGMHVVSVDGIELTEANQLGQLIRTTRRESPRDGTTTTVRLVIGRIRPPVQAPPTQRRLADAAEQSDNRTLLTCCCCCSVVGMVWQRIVCPKRGWTCYAVAAVLWCLWGVSVVMEQMATQDFREHYDAMNTTRTLATGYLFMLGLEEWGAVDYSDGFNYLSETATTLGTLALLVCWFLSSSLLKCARDRLRRTEPALWERAVADLHPLHAEHMTTSNLVPFCFCCGLARRLLTALLPDGHIINLCGPLPQWPDEEQGAAAPAAAQPTAPAEQADGERPRAAAASITEMAEPPREMPPSLPASPPATASTSFAVLSPRGPAPAPASRLSNVELIVDVPPTEAPAVIGAERAQQEAGTPLAWMSWFSPGGTQYSCRTPATASTTSVSV